MVDGQASQAISAQPIGAGIPDMQQVGDTAAQHQCGERAAHSGELGVLPTLGIDPAVERSDDPGARALHLHGLGQVAKSVEKPAHRGFGGGAAALGAADAVGDRRDHLLARLGQLGAVKGGGEILVCLRGPVFEAKPTRACTPSSTAAMAALPRIVRSASRASAAGALPSPQRAAGAAFPDTAMVMSTSSNCASPPTFRRHRSVYPLPASIPIKSELRAPPDQRSRFDCYN